MPINEIDEKLQLRQELLETRLENEKLKNDILILIEIMTALNQENHNLMVDIEDYEAVK